MAVERDTSRGNAAPAETKEFPDISDARELHFQPPMSKHHSREFAIFGIFPLIESSCRFSIVRKFVVIATETCSIGENVCSEMAIFKDYW